MISLVIPSNYLLCLVGLSQFGAVLLPFPEDSEVLGIWVHNLLQSVPNDDDLRMYYAKDLGLRKIVQRHPDWSLINNHNTSNNDPSRKSAEHLSRNYPASAVSSLSIWVSGHNVWVSEEVAVKVTGSTHWVEHMTVVFEGRALRWGERDGPVSHTERDRETERDICYMHIYICVFSN